MVSVGGGEGTEVVGPLLTVITTRGSATLTFVYSGKLTHNIIGPKIPSSYATPRKRARALTRTYRKGSYRFDCSIHPGMVLKLRVR